MSSNIFNAKRFLMLARQHFTHNRQFLLLSATAYMGVIFIVLSVIQLENQMSPLDYEAFESLMLAFVAVFGVLYVGHAFPAFRNKETAMNYLMVPGSILEKYLFEFLNRIGVIVVILPLIFWVTFHLHGYFFTIFTDQAFMPVGLSLDVESQENIYWIFSMVSSGMLLAFVFAFTGATTFIKQPLVKSLFAIAVIIMFYTGFSYIMIEYVGIGKYNLPRDMWIAPDSEDEGFRFLTYSFILGTIILLVVAYRKLIEKEV